MQYFVLTYPYPMGSATEGKCSLRDEDGRGKMECSLSDEFMIMVRGGEEGIGGMDHT